MWGFTKKGIENIKSLNRNNKSQQSKAPQKMPRLLDNSKFQWWLTCNVLCIVSVFVIPIKSVASSSSTFAIWLTAFCSGEMLFIAVSALISTLNDSIELTGRWPIIELMYALVGLVLYIILKVSAEDSETFSHLFAAAVTIAMWIVVLNRVIELYRNKGEEV